jgi:hypothetical protein
MRHLWVDSLPKPLYQLLVPLSPCRMFLGTVIRPHKEKRMIYVPDLNTN